VRLAVVNLSAGSGKTTCALHIAAALAGDGPALLVDADPRGTASALAEATRPHRFGVVRAGGRHLHHDLDDIARGTAHVVIDTPPGDPAAACAALLAADRVLVPSPEPSGDALAGTLALVGHVAALRPLSARVLAVRTTGSGSGADALPSRVHGAERMRATVPLLEAAGLCLGMDGPAAAVGPVVDELLSGDAPDSRHRIPVGIRPA
jgi:cellulose biosynthesis protein BcsQ